MMLDYAADVVDFVHDCYYAELLKDKPQPMTLDESAYNLDCLQKSELTDIPEDLTAESFMVIWNLLVSNGGCPSYCEATENDVQCNHKTEEENKMKLSELITTNAAEIKEEMVKRYRTVAESRGQCQYKLFIWEDGELEWLEGPQGDNSFLEPRQGEPRKLYYVTTVDHPCFDPWDMIEESRPDDDDECKRMEQEAIDYAVDCYEEALDDRIDGIIEQAEQEEQDQ